MNSSENKFTKRVRYQVDTLKCKKEVIRLILEGKSVITIARAITEFGEQCSKSSVDRYKRQKFIKGKVNPDGSIEVEEKEGMFTRVTKYSSNNESGIVETNLYADGILIER